MPKIPKTAEPCPQLVSGDITVLGQSVTIFAGTKARGAGAPILFYWHGTMSTAAEAQAFMGTQIQEITGEGGLVASFSTSLGTGTDTGSTSLGMATDTACCPASAQWFSDDYKMADQILACAVQQLNIDMHKIYTAGCGAGGLQAGTMVYQRSSYLAAAMPNSGGISPIPGLDTFDDPGHIPAVITMHGVAGMDSDPAIGLCSLRGCSTVVGLDFSQASLNEDMDIVSRGGFAVDCNRGGGWCDTTEDNVAAQWQFCKDHPYGVSPVPYKNGLPSGFPSYCTIL